MNSHSVQNHSYFPIILKNTKQLKRVEDGLKKENIYARRYFYPSLDTLKYINPKQYCKISRDISSKILCLPMYPELETINVKKICKIIKNNLC
jgi:dTDP-4-amino-4,6-dideoxygalactose transaminase